MRRHLNRMIELAGEGAVLTRHALYHDWASALEAGALDRIYKEHYCKGNRSGLRSHFTAPDYCPRLLLSAIMYFIAFKTDILWNPIPESLAPIIDSSLDDP
jgi:hypothetical protein